MELSADKSTLYFYTNNPQVITSQQMPVANKGRILTGLSIQQMTSQASISLPKSVVNNVLPSVLLSGDLSMSNRLDDPTFYASYVREQFSLYFSVFGIIVVGVLLIYGIMRFCMGMYSRNI